jgi:hypothetical protein
VEVEETSLLGGSAVVVVCLAAVGDSVDFGVEEADEGEEVGGMAREMELVKVEETEGSGSEESTVGDHLMHGPT